MGLDSWALGFSRLGVMLFQRRMNFFKEPTASLRGDPDFHNFYVFSLYRNPDIDDRIFYYLLASMAAVLAEDVRASFLFVGDLNIHNQEWLGSMTTNRHSVAIFLFATVSGCDQLVVGSTHARGGTLDLLTTDVPDLVRVAVVPPIGNGLLFAVDCHFDGSRCSKFCFLV